MIVDCMTDNRQRTVSEVRHALTKNGGNLGTDGSVTFMFDHVSQFLFGPDVDEEQIMEVGLEAGANDIDTDEDGLTEVLGAPSDFAQLRDAFEAAGLQPEVAEIIMRPQNEIELSDADGAIMQKIIDTLEDLDDVQKVYTNAVFDEE